MNWEKYNIDISKVRGGKSTCPKCSSERKNKTDLCLSVDLKEGLFNCHNCGFKGNASLTEFTKKQFVRPLPRLTTIGTKALSFFEDTRKIGNDTIIRFKITEAKEWMPQFQQEADVICFNYYRDEVLINIKFRGAKKSFKMQKDAELIFYNLDALKNEKSAVIVEGEIDCLSMHEAGVYNSVSVPNGASKGNQKLEYLDNCWQSFEGMEKIIICVDNDEAGNSLKEELARRLDKSRCYFANYPKDLVVPSESGELRACKDANEVLIYLGKNAVKNLVNNATAYPLEGILTVEDMAVDLMDMYKNGYEKGYNAGITGFDDLLTFVEGQLTMVTGTPGAGKDEFINYIAVGLSKLHSWKFGVCGFEEPPKITATKFVEKYAGRAFDFRKNPNDRISQEQFERGLLFVEEYFKFMNTDEVNSTIESVLEKAEQLVRRFGIKGLIISPWNCFEHNIPIGSNETIYTSMALGKILNFCKKFNVHCFLIAHPTKIPKDPKTGKYIIPTLYNISGSAHFFNKTHNGITVYRDYETNTVDVYVQKIKWSWLGKLGFCSFTYSTMTRQYSPV